MVLDGHLSKYSSWLVKVEGCYGSFLRMEASNTVCRVQDWSRSNFDELSACWECVIYCTYTIVYSYWVFQHVLYRIQMFNMFNMFTMHSRMKSCGFWFLNLPFKSPGSRIFLFSLQNDNLLSFQTLNSCHHQFLRTVPGGTSWHDQHWGQ